MLIQLKGGRLVDPLHGKDSIGDLYFQNGRIIDAPPAGQPIDEVYDVSGKIVMAGAIDVHSHIAGGNVNMARLLLPEHQTYFSRLEPHSARGAAGWTAFETGKRYAEMGYTTVIEPAVIPTHALAAQLELSDIPILDKGSLAVLGNDDFLLRLLRKGAGAQEISDYVGWTCAATKCLGIKTINAGGAAALKYNARKFSLDDEVPEYGVSSRAIVKALHHAVEDLAIPHPLHVHCNNLGIAGNVETALATMEASEGRPIHFAHIQFYGYGTEGERGFSSAAPEIAEAMTQHSNVTVDVGQILFGKTVTVSCDVLRQFEGRRAASPKKWLIHDGDASGGGIVPYRYKEKSFVNALQWAIGLENVLMAKDLWQVMFSTDHPNGAPFTRYPEIFHLLMDQGERARWLERIPETSREVSHLSEIDRELSFSEIAIITRAAPARLIGAKDRGHLGAGAIGDVAVYKDQPDRTAMFTAADLLFKDGELVVKDGEVINFRRGKTLRADVPYDPAIERQLSTFYDEVYGLQKERFMVPEHMMGKDNNFQAISCRHR